jgi:hypothetical protein
MATQCLPLFTKLKRGGMDHPDSKLFDQVCTVLRAGFPKLTLGDVEKHVDDERTQCALLLSPHALEAVQIPAKSRDVLQLDGSVTGYDALRQSVLLDAATDSVGCAKFKIFRALAS